MIHNKEYGAAMEELQAENDALKDRSEKWEAVVNQYVEAFTIAVEAHYIECLARVRHDAIIDAMHGNIIEPGEVTADYFCEVPALEKYAANLLPPATEQDT